MAKNIKNFEALEYVTWFKADGKNVENYGTQFFYGGLGLDEQGVADLKKALLKSISEVEEDIALIKNHLEEKDLKK